MINVCIITLAVILFFMGKGNQAARGIILGGLVISSAGALLAVYLGVMQDLDPQIYGFNCFLALVLSLFAYSIEAERKLELMSSFVVLSAYTYFTYVEFYFGGFMFYDFYGPAMLMVTIWQLTLLIRLGNVENNFGEWILGDNSIGSNGFNSGASRLSSCENDQLGADGLS